MLFSWMLRYKLIKDKLLNIYLWEKLEIYIFILQWIKEVEFVLLWEKLGIYIFNLLWIKEVEFEPLCLKKLLFFLFLCKVNMYTLN